MTLDKRLPSLFDLTGRVAVVTGGGGRLGFQMARALCEAGAGVVLASRDEEKCRRAAQRLEGLGGEAVAMAADVTDPASCDLLAQRTAARFGRLDIWVNNAAKVEGVGAALEAQTPEDWRATVDACLNSVFYGVQAAAGVMRAQGRGVIVNIASIYGLVSPDPRIYGDSGLNSPPQYAAAKGGVVQLTRYLAVHLAPHGIRVNSITPGGFLDGQDPDFVANYCARTPLGRMGNETDLMGAIVYLASDASAYVTGHNLVVDGGWTAW
jgi:NAD(P)-dependent dehydrogenase (short-subunit alcohol dehydrogenase family)